MRQRKFKFLLVTLLVVSGLMLAGGEVRAAIFSYSISGSVASNGQSTNASATYTYTLTKAGDTTLSYIDFEIPVEIVLTPGTYSPTTVNSYFDVSVTGGTEGSTEIFAGCIGDYGTKFGVGDCRYRVMKVNVTPISTPSTPLVVSLTLKGQNFAEPRKFGDLSQSEMGAILIKAGNGANTLSFTAPTPTVVRPIAPVITSFSASPNPSTEGLPVILSWVVPSGTNVAINDCTVTGNSVMVYPTGTTTYTLKVEWPDGTSSTATTTVTVNPAPILAISQQTFEKAGPSAKNITFYFADEVPVCSCTTDPGVILPYPCAEVPLPGNCSTATIDPVLVCLPFFGKTSAELLATCSDSVNCAVLPVLPCTDPGGNCFVRCDTLVDLTLDTTIEVGPHSCTCTTSRVRLLNGTYKTITSCTGSPCP